MGEKEVSQEAAMEFKPYKDELRLLTFEAVKKVKSIRRAITRGHVSNIGILLPKRPYNNRKDKPLENLKRSIYKSIKEAPLRTEYAKYKKQFELDGQFKRIIEDIV